MLAVVRTDNARIAARGHVVMAERLEPREVLHLYRIAGDLGRNWECPEKWALYNIPWRFVA